MLALALSALTFLGASESSWLPGDNQWGSHGLWRVDAAHGPVAGSIIAAGSSEMAYFGGLAAAGDKDFHTLERLHVCWAPINRLSLALSSQYISNKYTSFLNYRISQLGGPTLDAKYAWDLSHVPGLAVGAAVHSTFLTSTGSGGVVGDALVASAFAVSSYKVHPSVEASLNLGYQFDNSRVLLGPTLTKVDTYALGIGGPRHSFVVGAGVGARLPVHREVDVGPFAELTGAVGSDVPLAENPLRFTCGAKVYAAQSHRVEFELGVDARLTGGPSSGSPGLPPWNAFAQLSLHLFDHDTRSCDTDSDCDGGLSCESHTCVAVKQREVIRTVEEHAKTFVVVGLVLDADTGQAVKDAKVMIEGYRETPIGTDRETGAFKSFPLPVGPESLELTATAPDYSPVSVTTSRAKTNETKRVLIDMTRDRVPHYATVRGTIRDVGTRKAVGNAQIYVPQGNEKGATNASGEYSMQVRTGHVDVLISSPGYETQRRRMVLDDGDVIVLDVELAKRQ